MGKYRVMEATFWKDGEISTFTLISNLSLKIAVKKAYKNNVNFGGRTFLGFFYKKNIHAVKAYYVEKENG